MPEAIAEVFELQPKGKEISRGTAFAVSRKLALTAFHVIGDRKQGKVREGPFELRFPGGHASEAKYDDGDGELDFALLSLKPPLHEDLQPIPLTSEAQEVDGFVSRGFPALAGVNIFTISGTIRNLQATILGGVPAIQLFSHEAGAEMPLGGMSGAPVLVGSGGERAAIGLIRWNPIRPNNPALSVGGTVFACPVESIAERKPELRDGLVRVSTPLPPAVLHNLPYAPNPLFTGREAELEALWQGLQEGGTMAVTQTMAVHGLGGVGKTQLAVQYAWQHLREFDAVLWARAESPQAFEASLAVLASVLRLPEAKEREQGVQLRAVLGWLAEHRRWLLIADNADTEAAVQTIQERLPPSFPGAVLTTSRLSRWPVNMPQLALELFKAEEAARYLLARVRERQHEAGGELAAGELAEELGNLPLALEQAASFMIEMRVSFERYREYLLEARPELLSYVAQGATHYPASVAKTWSITLERLSPLSRALLRLGAWFAPEAIPRGIFAADKALLSEALDPKMHVSDLAVDLALTELARFSLIRIAPESLSVHRLLQAVEQDALSPNERGRWLLRAVQLFNAFAPLKPDDVRTWGVWLPLAPHAESLLEHMKREGVELPPVALLANQLGLLLYTRAAHARAEPLFRRALEIDEKSYGPDHPRVATRLNNLAAILQATNRLQEAEPLYRRALGIDESYGPDHPRVAIDLNNLAQLLQATNRLQEAEPLMRRALGIDEKSYGPDHPKVAIRLNNLALLLQATNRLQEAEPLYRRALGIDEKSYGPDHPIVATRLNNLALLLQATNRLQEAEPLTRRALGIDEKSYGPDHPKVAIRLNTLAALLEATNRLQEAEPLMRRALGIDEKSLGPDHPKVATDLNYLAVLLKATNRLQEAEPLYRRALAIDEKSLGPEYPKVATDLNNLASELLIPGGGGVRVTERK